MFKDNFLSSECFVRKIVYISLKSVHCCKFACNFLIFDKELEILWAGKQGHPPNQNSHNRKTEETFFAKIQDSKTPAERTINSLRFINLFHFSDAYSSEVTRFRMKQRHFLTKIMVDTYLILNRVTSLLHASKK